MVRPQAFVSIDAMLDVLTAPSTHTSLAIDAPNLPSEPNASVSAHVASDDR